MKNRSIAAVLLLPFVTFGLYSLYWSVSTKKELNERGAEIPTAWLIIVPIVSIWWLWKYSEGVEKVTGGKMSGVVAFLLQFFLGWIGQAILQNEFNHPAGMTTPAFAGADPALSFDSPAPVAPSFAPIEPVAPVAPSFTPTEPVASVAPSFAPIAPETPSPATEEQIIPPSNTTPPTA